jgi:aspartyl-tRNA(Asn)/glutamyl-tRNA(Gln) amidotransferase subunit B
MNSELRSQYEAVIGIECHVQLATKSKLFCGCDNDSRNAEPNTHICEVCMGMPGALPVLNKRAVDLALRLGLALGAEYPDNLHTKFDRKNYFYPDSPKGYQITQFDEPIVPNGVVAFPLNGTVKKVGITRAHLEGDAGKLTHPDGRDYSLVDLNRAETPLLEIVSEPDLRSSAEAKAYAQELHNLARYSGASDANLYYGNMRFDVNVSVHKPSTEFGTRTETKNLNSFRHIEQAIEYEIRRQIAALENGERIRQETRGWNEAKGETYAMRSKEDADEYRYFPEPDLPPLIITKAMVTKQHESLGIMPNVLRNHLAVAGIAIGETEALIADPEAAIFWDNSNILDSKVAKFSFNWLIGDRIKLAETTGIDIATSQITPEILTIVGQMVSDGKLSSSNAKVLLADLWSKPEEPLQRASALGLLQESDIKQLGEVVDEVIAKNPQAVADYKAGNERAFGALVGQAMKATQGKGNPPVINQLLKDRLG